MFCDFKCYATAIHYNLFLINEEPSLQRDFISNV